MRPLPADVRRLPSSVLGSEPPSSPERLLKVLAGDLLRSPHAVVARAVDLGSAGDATWHLPAELSGAGLRRRATFLAGRACAHAALAALNVRTSAIPIGAGGAPVWPKGSVGSISHTARVAAAVVASDPPVAGLGLDVEDDNPLDDVGTVGLICRPDEMPAAQAPSEAEKLLWGKLVFVVKEAVYKLHHPLGGAFLDFHDVRVTLEPGAGRFCAEVVHREQRGSAGSLIRGGFVRDSGWLAALAVFSR